MLSQFFLFLKAALIELCPQKCSAVIFLGPALVRKAHRGIMDLPLASAVVILYVNPRAQTWVHHSALGTLTELAQDLDFEDFRNHVVRELRWCSC